MNIHITSGTRMFTDHKNILGRSNAFPDSIIFGGQTYVAFRAASLHPPTSTSRIIIFKKQSSGWFIDTEFKITDHDVRNPKFYIDNGSLVVVFAVTPLFPSLGKKSMMYIAEKKEGGVWTQAKEADIPIPLSPYRIRYIDSTPVMSAFNDFLNISEITAPPQVSFLTSETTHKWKEFEPFSNIHIPGSETDFIEMDDFIYFVARMDFSIGKQAGTKIIRFDKTTGNIIEKITRIKLDAPYLFIHKRKILLLARKNIFFKGRYDLLPKWVPRMIKNIINWALYWLTPKSLALWEIDKKHLTVKHILNFPVQGDTGYAVAQQTSDSSYDVYTYSSMWGRYMPWLFGQFRRTEIVKFNLEFNMV